MLRISGSAVRALLVWVVGWVLLVLLISGSARAAAVAATPDKTLSPYFVVEGADPNVEALPLESTKVDVQITGVIAEVTVTQAYKNAGKKPINAQYVFPASTRAAVHGMRMQVRDQIIEAQIKEKEQAAKTFEAAKQAGKSASLLEQQRPNVFTMKVANVMPGDHLQVSLRYSELLVPTSGVYELDYPTVVGPRYSNESVATAPAKDRFIASPYTRSGAAPSYTFELSGSLATPMPVHTLESPSHSVLTSTDNPSLKRFSLAPSEKAGGNRDFILRYRLSGDAIQSGLSLFDAGGEKFFLLQVEPPKRVPSELIPPREYVFIVDVSGSMGGCSSVNRFLIEGVAKAGQGEPFVVTDPGQANATAERLREYVRSPVLTDVKVAYEGFDAYDVEPKAIPDALAERPIVIQGKYRGDPKGFVSLSGLTGKGGFAQRFDVSQLRSRPEHRALSFLWARSRVASLSDFGFGEPTPLAKTEITSLGLRYSLLTEYTSFVAVARKVVNPGGAAQNVDQPLPMPAGVSNSALGPDADGADEPELWLLLLLGAVALALGATRPRRSELVS